MSEAKYVSTKPLEEFSVNKKRKSDLISRLSELRSQYNCFDESERDAYHTLSEAIKALKFAEWVAKEIFSEDMDDAFAELACRRLEKVRMVTADGNKWVLKVGEEE